VKKSLGRRKKMRRNKKVTGVRGEGKEEGRGSR